MWLQAVDADTGNNSALAYTVDGGPDADHFYTDPPTGQLYSKVDFSSLNKRQLNLTARVTDDHGRGHSDRTRVTVSMMLFMYF